MKKIMISLFAVALLAGCSSYFDYYRGGVKYTQDGTDCIYSSEEQGKHFSNDVRRLRGENRIVYRNTLCANLYNRDMANIAARNDRRIIAPAADAKPVEQSCGFSSCGSERVIKRRYIIVSQ